MKKIKLSQHRNFTQKVYDIVSKIPEGKVMTYKQVATRAGNPGASRAVGTAMKNNPDRKSVPCHRVVASDGSMSGYAFGGVNAKKDMLKKEGVVFVGNKVDLNNN